MTGEGNKPDHGFTRIEPAPVELAAASDTPEARQAAPAAEHGSRHPLLWAGLALMLLIAAGVFFVLPRYVASPTSESTALAPTDAGGESASATPRDAAGPVRKPGGAPWEQAQEAQLRRDSQATLEKMLQAQNLLSERAVTDWAPEEYEQALALARDGDAKYNERDFAGARDAYERGLGILQELQDRVDEVFAEALARGEQALADGDSASALAEFDRALAIDPLDRAANDGRQRAESLDEVLDLIRQGDRLLAAGELDGAAEAYAQASVLDPESERARAQAAVVEQRRRDRRFNALMSSGFAALYDGRPDEAGKTFRQALQLRPGAAEARDALRQSEHESRARTLAALIGEAGELEDQERWHEAVERYSRALEIDAALASAIEGRQRSKLRAEIHDRIDGILDQPTRLYDAEALNEAEAFQRTVSAVRNPGPELAGRIARLDDLLRKMRQPITVQLRSDNLTRVTVHRVGSLGTFTTHELSLRPGRYVAVGVREGYRDARVEFTLDPDRPAPVIEISADDKIAFGSGG
ncbi:hypothetical protein [Elongatibacter sediminis]|uniref:Tetratricopeptide repeat protein n=1 Tax=Elongatibacter sediminis TaxID=3119006 RepID=A0AAW9RC52_9GAMM